MSIEVENDMKVALMQPTFLPWIGYFELVAKADRFVILDDFQFEYRSFGHRNRLFINKDQVGWVTVPVDKKNAYLKSYKTAKILEGTGWRKKLWRGIEENYRKAPYWTELSDDLYRLVSLNYYTLAKQNIEFILWLVKLLEFSTEIKYSSELKATGHKSEHIKNILREVAADSYLCANGSFGYMFEEGIFPLDGINVLFQNANLKEYHQTRSTKGFVPYLSIVDALLNVGPEKTKELVLKTTDHWLSWDEMVLRRREGTGINGQ